MTERVKTKTKKKSNNKRASSKSAPKTKALNVPVIGAATDLLWSEAKALEDQLEQELLADTVKTARVALEELKEETKTQPFERRRGIRLREKAQRVERAFNRLRALRKGDLLPERHPDD